MASKKLPIKKATKKVAKKTAKAEVAAPKKTKKVEVEKVMWFDRVPFTNEELGKLKSCNWQSVVKTHTKRSEKSPRLTFRMIRRYYSTINREVRAARDEFEA